MNNIDIYINKLVALLEPIEFDEGTLGGYSLVKPFRSSVNSFPNTEVNVFLSTMSSNMLESRLQKRLFNIVTRIRCNMSDREQQATSDMHHLLSEVMTVYENNLSNITWENGYLHNDNLESRERNYNDNYFTMEIPIIIAQRVVITV